MKMRPFHQPIIERILTDANEIIKQCFQLARLSNFFFLHCVSEKMKKLNKISYQLSVPKGPKEHLVFPEDASCSDIMTHFPQISTCIRVKHGPNI